MTLLVQLPDIMILSPQNHLSNQESTFALHQLNNSSYDIRVQKIGSHYRAYKRVNSNWKGNVGSSVLTEIEVTDTFKFWADIVYQEVFNSEMDIFTVDAVHTTDDKYYILEINDSASGFAPQNYAQDMKHVRDVVLERVKKLLQ